jgi:hypothetical protein
MPRYSLGPHYAEAFQFLIFTRKNVLWNTNCRMLVLTHQRAKGRGRVMVKMLGAAKLYPQQDMPP